MSDIVEKLRAPSNWLQQARGIPWKGVVSEYDRTPFEAADEIERLQADLAEAEALLRRARDCIDEMDADNWKVLPEEYYSRGTPAAVAEIDAWLARRRRS